MYFIVGYIILRMFLINSIFKVMCNILLLYWNLFGNELLEKSLEIILINVYFFVVFFCEEGKEKLLK